MILLFPNLDTFRLTLSGGVVPTDVSLSPATVSYDATGRIFVETDAKLTKGPKEKLEKLKVLGAKRHASEDVQKVSSWLQILPLTPSQLPQMSSQIAVLFELPSLELLPTVAAEMLRLGNDRQSYRVLSEAGSDRVLLRVIAPPHYTMLRAIDRSSFGGAAIRGYLEATPNSRVWIELGYSHAFATQIKPSEGQLLLLRSPNDWQYVPDEPFEDVYEILNLTLPQSPSSWKSKAMKSKLQVALRLVAGDNSDPTEMWVLRGDAKKHLDELVRDTRDTLMEQLRYAIGTDPNGQDVLILKTAPSRKSPPLLTLPDAVQYKPFWRIPNLFLPIGTRLHPQIRRDVITKLLADDRDKLVWLSPQEAGAFTPETIPEDSFRPLSEWVEYIIETNKVEVKEWIEATEFGFEGFACSENPPKPKVPPNEKTEKEKKQPKEETETVVKSATTKGGRKSTSTQANATFTAPVIEVKPPSEWKIRCDELEKQFVDLEGPLDAPERLALWPELATANTGMGQDRRSEAAICWVNSMWEQATLSPEFTDGWARSETPTLGKPTAAEFDLLMKPSDPMPSQLRAFTAYFLNVAGQPTQPDWLKSRLPTVQKYLEDHESKLPIRGVWLAALRLAQLADKDVLGLARVRDRLLNRLLERGLSPEVDLPGFLRFSGLKNSDRVRQVRERMSEIHAAARSWAEKSLKPSGNVTTQADSTCTLAYLDLMFAFGMAKLGELTVAQQLIENARKTLSGTKATETKGIVANFLFKVYQFRIENVLGGKPHAGLLSPALIEELDAIQKRGGNAANDPNKLAHYVINRMREQSDIIEPQEKNDPYAEWMKHGDELKRDLAELPKLKDPNALGKRIRDLFNGGSKGKVSSDTKFTVLHDALHLCPRVGQEFTVEFLRFVPGVLKNVTAGTGGATDQAKKQGQLLERAMFLAAHFDKTELVQELGDQFIEYVHAKPDEQRYELVNIVAGRCLKSLRKVGLRDETDRLLQRMQNEILKGKTLAQLKVQYGTKPDMWADALQTMLNIAGGWLTFGLVQQATTILETARQEILAGGGKMSVQKFTKLCETYVLTLGQGPPDLGMPKVIEMFRKIEPTRITNTFTTAPYYSRLHLNIIEDVVMAMVSDDFALGQSGKRWLDEDEHLVRRRIHRDMRELVKKTGV